MSALTEWSSTSQQRRVLLSETIMKIIETSSFSFLPSMDQSNSLASSASISPSPSSRNRALHQQVLLWNKVLRSFPGDIDDLLTHPAGDGHHHLQQRLVQLAQKYSQDDSRKQYHFEVIKTHHASFVRNGWNINHSFPDVKKSFEEYGEAAVEIGKRSWAKNSHHWTMNKLFLFFRKKGLRKELFHEYQALDLSHQLPSIVDEGGDPLQFLDVGSCYDPLSQLLLEMKDFGPVDITAVDLHPMNPHVYTCDLLQVELSSKATKPLSTQKQQSLGFLSGQRILSLPWRSYHAVSLTLVLSYLPTPALRYQMIQKASELLFHPPSLLSSDQPMDLLKRYGVLTIVDTYRSVTKNNWISIDGQENQEDASDDRCPCPNFQNASRLIPWLPVMESIGFKLLKHEVIHDYCLIHNRMSSRKKTKKASVGLFFRLMTPEERRKQPMRREYHSFAFCKRYISTPSCHPHLPIGIIGTGIGGSALAFILHQHGIPYLLFDRDEGISSRPQGYAVTIQQGISVLRSIGITTSVVENRYNRNVSNVGEPVFSSEERTSPIIIPNCTISRSHVSFDKHGGLLGVFGPPGVPFLHRSHPYGFIEFSLDLHSHQPHTPGSEHSKNTRQNIHMPRQALRDTLLSHSDLFAIKWDHKFEDCLLHDSLTENSTYLTLRFSNHPKEYSVSGLVGCDGIYSNVRKILYERYLNQGDSGHSNPKELDESFHERNLGNQLNYLGLFVILGISPRVDDGDTSLTRRKVQWVDGVTRVFSMPYDDNHDMWQMSFPMTTQQILQFQSKRKTTSSQQYSHRGHFSSIQLKELALMQCHSWHATLTAMLERTETNLISGHPVYDREPTDLAELKRIVQIPQLPITLLGDSWHPMSPFKAQGANQALLDALSLSKQIVRWWRQGKVSIGSFFCDYESEAFHRSARKVLKSRSAAQYLHSSAVMTPGNVTRASVAEQASK